MLLAAQLYSRSAFLRSSPSFFFLTLSFSLSRSLALTAYFPVPVVGPLPDDVGYIVWYNSTASATYSVEVRFVYALFVCFFCTIQNYFSLHVPRRMASAPAVFSSLCAFEVCRLSPWSPHPVHARHRRSDSTTEDQQLAGNLSFSITLHLSLPMWVVDRPLFPNHRLPCV